MMKFKQIVDFKKGNIRVELSIIFVLSVFVYLLAGHFDLMEEVVEYLEQHEQWQLDEVIIVSLFIVVALAVFSVRRWQESRIRERLLEIRYEENQQALSEIKQLRGIIPICSSCKKVRDDEGYWLQVETYVRDQTDVEFSHGICPDCKMELYPDLCGEDDTGNGESSMKPE